MCAALIYCLTKLHSIKQLQFYTRPFQFEQLTVLNLTVSQLYVLAPENGKINIFNKQFHNLQSWVPSAAQIGKV